jgi:trans-2,3-dihydro-3-hydroxyanthranilate isomerase
MAIHSYRYVHLDVFTSRPFEGNQLAVFPDAAGLAPEMMQTIAREMNFSESTFVLPRERTDTDVRMRIFTPGRESMAGHPVIGSTVALAHGDPAPRRRRSASRRPPPVDPEWTLGVRAQKTHRVQATSRQSPVPIEDVAGAARVVGLDADRRGGRRFSDPCGGVRPRASAVARSSIAQRQRAAVRALTLPAGVDHHYFLFALDPLGSNEPTVYSRMFAPDVGITEDPATGSATGPLGCYLLHHRLVTPERARSMMSLQGVKMGRPSRLHISIAGTPDAITEVKVGGQAVVVGEGTLLVRG